MRAPDSAAPAPAPPPVPPGSREPERPHGPQVAASAKPTLGQASRLRRFVLVGASAAAVHLAVVALGVRLGLHPLAANVIAFHVAFVVSYSGQRRLTFADRAVAARDALPRFLAVSYLGFATNEAMYAALLAFTRLHHLVALAIVLVAVAAMTFTLSRAWAFRERAGAR